MTSEVQDSVRTQTQEVRCKLFLFQSAPPWRKHTSYIFLTVAQSSHQRCPKKLPLTQWFKLLMSLASCVEGGYHFRDINIRLACDQANEVGGWSPRSDLPGSALPSWQKARTMSHKRKSLYFCQIYRPTFSITCSNLVSRILSAFLLM